jgi:PKD repeat protein
MFVKGFQSDLWFGLSEFDVVEMGVWDRNKNEIGWDTLYQSKSYDTVTVSNFDTLNNVVTYSYQALKPDYILHNTQDILMDPADQVSSSFHILTGSFFITYNTTREMAGNIANQLVIKDIASSRKELKLYPLLSFNDSYTAFCQHKFLMNDVSSLYVKSLIGCPYDQIYNQVSSLYPNQINTIRNLFFIPSDGEMQTFFKNIYEDLLLYSSTPVLSVVGMDVVSQNLIRIPGISTYFNNYLLSNSTMIVDFDMIDTQFGAFASASIERKFSSVGQYPSKEYVDAKAFVYDYFTKYFYMPFSTTLRTVYNDRYFGYFKNALNVGDNRLLPILSVGMMDERTDPSDPLTLLVKLKDELPLDLPAQTRCWVSNISLTPYVISAIITSNEYPLIHTIGPPNFSAPIPNTSLTNTNTSYTANDLKYDDDTERDITISKNINELSVDYTDFSNFVVFSSAEMRLKIFKNKVINLYGLSSSLNVLNIRADMFIAYSGSIYPYYQKEYDFIQDQMDSIISTFDGYESYLYNSAKYDYEGGSFVSASYIADQDAVAMAYDKNNRDSLINTCPEHILINSDNDDYIIFLSMVGHFFDNIYIYIANLPSEKNLGNDPTSKFTRRVVDYMLETFGWKTDDSIEQANLLNNYLTSEQLNGLNSMSAEERLKTVRNRILTTLPQIYKTKGTEESVNLILACYGIPSVLLSIREYGGVTYDDPKASYTLYERVYMRQWNTSSIYDSYDLQLPTGSHTYLFKVSIDGSEPYTYGKEQVLFGRVEDTSRTSQSGSGEWAVGFVRIPKKDAGKIFFRIGYKGQESLKMYSQEFPLFDGNIYSVMLRHNYPDPGFEYTPNYDAVPAEYDLYVKRNEFGNQVVNLSSSAICYDSDTNIRFGQGGRLKIGGWFADLNGQGYTGCFDKFQAWRDPVPDANVEDYTNNFSAYAFRGTGSIPYESLYFRMHTDYPFNQLERGRWTNGNPYFAISSSVKLNTLYAEPNADVDCIVSSMAWSGSMKIVDGPCGPVSQPVYPYQFKVLDYPSTWGISKYGPNKFCNEKTRFISQSVEARLDNLDRSTYVDPNATAPDSNQVGFYVDPQDFKNRDIVRYFGNFDFMNAIGDPSYEFSSSYDSMRLFRKEYSEYKNQYSGSRTLFNELLITYKLYFNRSVFDAIKNVIPARTNAIIGVVIEPTILERPKYQLKVVTSSMDYAQDASMNHYAFDSASLCVVSASLISSRSLDLNLKYLSDPTRVYPVNYGGNYIRDLTDSFEMGHFAAGVPPRTIDFTAYMPDRIPSFPINGYAPLTVKFVNNSFGIGTYVWDFGDGSSIYTPAEDNSSGQANPEHVYQNPGIYTVTLTGYYGAFSFHQTQTNYVSVSAYNMSANFDANPKNGSAPMNVGFSNLSTNASTYAWDFGFATSTLVNPTQLYSDPGIYTVGLVASTNVEGNTYAAQYISNSYISVSAPVIANACNGPYLQEVGGGIMGYKPFTQQFVYSLGNLQTPVTFSYNVSQSASRYVVSINNVTQLDTQWLCPNSPSQTEVDNINNAMLPYGPNPNPTYLSASIGNIVFAPGGDGTIYFTKNTPFFTTTVQVFNPFNTTCSFTMSCPTSLPTLVMGPLTPATYSCNSTITQYTDVNGIPYPCVFGVNFLGSKSDDDLILTWTNNYPIRIVCYYPGDNIAQHTVLFNSGNTIYDKWNIGDTGYQGVNNAITQAQLASALATKGEPPQSIVGNLKTMLISFNENEFFGGGAIHSTPTSDKVFRIEVHAPIPGTTYTVNLTCPF